MNDYQQYFNWPDIQIEYFYMYFFVALIIAAYLVLSSKSKFRFELFFISFYLLTGNINQILTISIPGLDLFEIQPIRFIFLLLAFLIIRKLLFSKEKVQKLEYKKSPWFELALYGYVILLVVSVLVNSSQIGISEVLSSSIDAVAFVVLMIGLSYMEDKPSYDVIGRSIMVGAVFTTVVSLIQLWIDPYFLRIGDYRIAFGTFIRSNGIFSTEYFNSYYLIIAISWVLLTIKNDLLKVLLVGLFILGVISSFQRMSWIILILVLATYLIFIRKIKIEKLVLAGLSCLVVILIFSIFYYREIMNSSLVKERLSDNIDRRKGYYSLVMENIGNRPIFGYGDLKNEVYYTNILQITGSRERALAESGDLHSGYFSALFLYGLPAFVFFFLFVILSVIYYARLYRENLYFAIPLLVGVIYMIGNLTNTFLFLKYISILYAIHIGIGMGISKKNEKLILQN